MSCLSFTPRRRYLVQFEPKRSQHTFADVLIIGGGIAGIRAALAVDPKLQTIVITKDKLIQSNSVYAQGGIAGVMDPLDDVENHAADTIAAGKGLCNPDIVDMVVREAPESIQTLIDYGAKFDKVDGEIALTREGGHSHPRVVHALGDATGKEVMRALIDTIRNNATSRVWERTFTIDLLTFDGQCRGAVVWSERHGKTFIWAKQTILATGGAGQLFRETTNPSIATADGHAIAFRAGAELRDMELMQFHPTVLYIAGSSRHLISEAVRGEGAILRDASGYQFMQDVDPKAELAPRDVVSRAITNQMAKTNHPCVYLDVTHKEDTFIRERFPHINKVCAEFGLDITRDLIPVRPGAHYMIGGISVDENGKSTLPGLWGAGEVTSTGLHGANRLGSNSLLEGLVFGRRAGEGASALASSMEDDFRVPPLVSTWERHKRDDEELNLVDMRNSLNSLMWRNVGIQRDAEGLSEAVRQVEFWGRYASSREFFDPQGWELQNLLLVSRLMVISAEARRESRGVHWRSDFPDTDEALAQHQSISVE
ncbi:MAG: L-aspartate oxidase [Planctomycetaceae bacterium]|nr:L-aspartate oxidase [Planctomycetaceae bacterium]